MSKPYKRRRDVPEGLGFVFGLLAMLGVIWLAAGLNWPDLSAAYRPGYAWIGPVTLVVMLACLGVAIAVFWRCGHRRLLGFVPLTVFLYPFGWLLLQHALVHG